MTTSLLTKKDLALIENRGTPYGVCPDFALEINGSIVFTLRGIQFYTEALRRVGLTVEALAPIKTKKALLSLHSRVSGIRLDRAMAELEGELPNLKGSIRAASQALIDGNLEASLAISKKMVEYPGRAANVVVGYFGVGYNSRSTPRNSTK